MQGRREGGPFERWARGAVSQLSGRVAAWVKGSGLDGRGRLQSRALEREKVGREAHGGPGSTPLTPTLWAPSTRLTCICRGKGGGLFLEHFGIKVPEVSCGGREGVEMPGRQVIPGETQPPRSIPSPTPHPQPKRHVCPRLPETLRRSPARRAGTKAVSWWLHPPPTSAP